MNRLAEAHGEGYNFFTDPHLGYERTMLMRVILGKADQYTVAWFHHESLEASLLRGNSGVSDAQYLTLQESAHHRTLDIQGNSSTDLYHPSVVRAYDEYFGPLYPRK